MTFDFINGDYWKLFNNFRNNSGNDEPVDIIVISDDEPTDDKATNDEATNDEATDDEATDDKAKDYRISFNFDELERQLGIECKDQVRCKSNLFMLLYNYNLLYYYFCVLVESW